MHKLSFNHIAPLVLLAFLSLFALSGCKSKDEQPGVTELKVIFAGIEEPDMWYKIFDDFEEAHPKIKLDPWQIPWEFVLDKLLITTAGGKTPDVTIILGNDFPAAAAKELFEPLEKYVKRDNFDMDDFYPEAIRSAGLYNGILYGIPLGPDVFAMFYNKTMFDKYHQPYPDWDWDWKKWVQVCKKLTRDTDGDGKIDQWGAGTDPFWSSYVYQNGGSLLSNDLKRCTLNRPDAYEAVQWRSDLINKYRVAPGIQETSLVGEVNLFCNGKLGTLVLGAWATKCFFKDQVKTFQYDVGPTPKGKLRASYVEGSCWCILRGSKHKKEAWELLKWMTSKKVQTTLTLEMQNLPSRRSVTESGAFESIPGPPKHKMVFVKMIPYGRGIPPVPSGPEMLNLMTSEITLAMLGRETAKEACAKVAPVIDQMLRHQE